MREKNDSTFQNHFKKYANILVKQFFSYQDPFNPSKGLLDISRDSKGGYIYFNRERFILKDALSDHLIYGDKENLENNDRFHDNDISKPVFAEQLRQQNNERRCKAALIEALLRHFNDPFAIVFLIQYLNQSNISKERGRIKTHYLNEHAPGLRGSMLNAPYVAGKLDPPVVIYQFTKCSENKYHLVIYYMNYNNDLSSNQSISIDDLDSGNCDAVEARVIGKLSINQSKNFVVDEVRCEIPNKKNDQTVIEPYITIARSKDLQIYTLDPELLFQVNECIKIEKSEQTFDQIYKKLYELDLPTIEISDDCYKEVKTSLICRHKNEKSIRSEAEELLIKINDNFLKFQKYLVDFCANYSRISAGNEEYFNELKNISKTLQALKLEPYAGIETRLILNRCRSMPNFIPHVIKQLKNALFQEIRMSVEALSPAQKNYLDSLNLFVSDNCDSCLYDHYDSFAATAELLYSFNYIPFDLSDGSRHQGFDNFIKKFNSVIDQCNDEKIKKIYLILNVLECLHNIYNCFHEIKHKYEEYQILNSNQGEEYRKFKIYEKMWQGDLSKDQKRIDEIVLTIVKKEEDRILQGLPMVFMHPELLTYRLEFVNVFVAQKAQNDEIFLLYFTHSFLLKYNESKLKQTGLNHDQIKKIEQYCSNFHIISFDQRESEINKIILSLHNIHNNALEFLELKKSLLLEKKFIQECRKINVWPEDEAKSYCDQNLNKIKNNIIHFIQDNLKNVDPSYLDDKINNVRDQLIPKHFGPFVESAFKALKMIAIYQDSNDKTYDDHSAIIIQLYRMRQHHIDNPSFWRMINPFITARDPFVECLFRNKAGDILLPETPPEFIKKNAVFQIEIAKKIAGIDCNLNWYQKIKNWFLYGCTVSASVRESLPDFGEQIKRLVNDLIYKFRNDKESNNEQQLKRFGLKHVETSKILENMVAYFNDIRSQRNKIIKKFINVRDSFWLDEKELCKNYNEALRTIELKIKEINSLIDQLNLSEKQKTVLHKQIDKQFSKRVVNDIAKIRREYSNHKKDPVHQESKVNKQELDTSMDHNSNNKITNKHLMSKLLRFKQNIEGSNNVEIVIQNVIKGLDEIKKFIEKEKNTQKCLPSEIASVNLELYKLAFEKIQNLLTIPQQDEFAQIVKSTEPEFSSDEEYDSLGQISTQRNDIVQFEESTQKAKPISELMRDLLECLNSLTNSLQRKEISYETYKKSCSRIIELFYISIQKYLSKTTESYRDIPGQGDNLYKTFPNKGKPLPNNPLQYVKVLS